MTPNLYVSVRLSICIENMAHPPELDEYADAIKKNLGHVVWASNNGEYYDFDFDLDFSDDFDFEEFKTGVLQAINEVNNRQWTITKTETWARTVIVRGANPDAARGKAELMIDEVEAIKLEEDGPEDWLIERYP